MKVTSGRALGAADEVGGFVYGEPFKVDQYKDAFLFLRERIHGAIDLPTESGIGFRGVTTDFYAFTLLKRKPLTYAAPTAMISGLSHQDPVEPGRQ